MNTREIVEWFKTSIPGIVILGAFGSILALALLKISKRALPNLSSFVKNRFLFPLLYRFYKRAVIEQIIAARLMKAGERTKLLISLLLDIRVACHLNCGFVHSRELNDTLFCGYPFLFVIRSISFGDTFLLVSDQLVRRRVFSRRSV